MIFSKLKATKILIDKYLMHNLYVIFAKILNICKQMAGNLENESGNIPITLIDIHVFALCNNED